MLASPVFPEGEVIEKIEVHSRAPRLPVLPPTFRDQVESELDSLPDLATSPTTKLHSFAELVHSSPHLTDVARAVYIDWIARVFQARNETSTGLGYAHDAYRLRRRALGAGHAQCAESLRLIEALRVSPSNSVLIDSELTKESQPQVKIDPPSWSLATIALESGSPDQIERALKELRSTQTERESSSKPASVTDAEQTEQLLLAKLLIESDQTVEAEKTLTALARHEEVRATVKKPATLLLSDLHFEAGRLAASETLLDKIDTPADEAEFVALAWRKARLQNAKGYGEEAERDLTQLIHKFSIRKSPDPTSVARVHHVFAEVSHSRERFQAALREATLAAAQRKHSLGPFHRDTLDSERLMARSLAGLGQGREAADRLTRLMDLSSDAFGLKCALTLSIQFDLAATLSESPSFKDNQALASELFSRNILERAALFGEHDARTLASQHQLAIHRLREGRPTSAAKLLRKVLDQRTTRMGLSHPATIDACRTLAVVLDGLGRTSEALELFQSNVENCRTHFEVDHPFNVQTLKDLCEHLQRHNQLEESNLEVARRIESLKSFEGQTDSNIRAIYQGLARTGDPISPLASLGER